MSNKAPAPGFSGEISFAKTDDYIDSLLVLETMPRDWLNISFPEGEGDAVSFAEAAKAIAIAERAQDGLCRDPSGLMSLLAVGRDETTRYPLNWLNISEHKRSAERRSCHELYVVLEGEHLVVTFEHGKFGYRHERHAQWSSAIARVAQLMSGECSWHQFGDIESQNTMLGKGQFYWQNQSTLKLEPVDNFVFRVFGTLDIRLSGVGHRCALEVTRAGYESGHEWYADYSEGLRRMADVLAGEVDLEKFGEQPAPELYATAQGKRTPEVGGAPLATCGQFFVETIYQSKDVWAAPVLVYQTAEGKQVALRVTDTYWQVRLGDETGQEERTRTFPLEYAAGALLVLAQVLNGTLLWQNF